MQDSIQYSIVIPHYNSEGLLKELLRSIPRREDIQTIVVDDASTEPAIYELARSSEFANVEFYFLENNCTAGGARNIGLTKCRGRYVLFADSDDIFHHDAFDIFDKYSGNNLDLVQFKVNSFSSSSEQREFRHKYLLKQYRLWGKLKFLAVSPPYAKLIKHELIRKFTVRFNEVPYGNDVCFSAKIALLSQTTQFVKEEVYSVREINSSLTQTKTTRSKAIRIRELANKNMLIVALANPWSSSIYLSRKHVLRETDTILNDDTINDSELKSACRYYRATLPRHVKLLYSLLKTFRIL